MFNKQTQYAIRAVTYLAVKSEPRIKIGVNVIANELGVPKQFLSKILQNLVNHKLLHSSKGKAGGFYLTKKDLDSNLRSIIELFGGDDIFHTCVMGLPKCSSENPCPLHESSVEYRGNLIKILDEQSIRELAESVIKDGFSI